MYCSSCASPFVLRTTAMPETHKGDKRVDQEPRPRLLSSPITAHYQSFVRLTLTRTGTSCLFSRTTFTNYFLQGLFKANLNWTDQTAVNCELCPGSGRLEPAYLTVLKGCFTNRRGKNKAQAYSKWSSHVQKLLTWSTYGHS